VAKDEPWNRVRRGARLILAYDASTGAFAGTVENTTERILSDVRVEVHLSNGTELGPTRRTDLRPGQRMKVELSAIDEEFEWWTTHPSTAAKRDTATRVLGSTAVAVKRDAAKVLASTARAAKVLASTARGAKRVKREAVLGIRASGRSTMRFSSCGGTSRHFARR
jgi:hypothetical protein